MKKPILIIISTIAIMMFLPFCVCAQTQADEYKGVYETAKTATDELLEQAGIDNVDYSQLISFSPARAFEIIKNLVSGKSHAPLMTAAEVIVILIVFSVINSFNINRAGDENYYSFFENALVVFAVIIPLSDSLSAAVGAITGATNFMFSFIPVFAGFVSASGQPTSSYLYSASMLGFAGFCNGFSARFVLPIISVITSLNVFSALDSDVKIAKITSAIKKIINVALSVSASLFVGLTNLKSSLAGSADSLALKGVKMATGAFVPVIGSALGEAINSALGSMGLIKSTLGVFGIIAVSLCFTPCIVELLMWYLSLTVCSVFAGALGLKGGSEMIDSILGCISVVNVILVLSALVFILTTGHMLRG